MKTIITIILALTVFSADAQARGRGGWGHSSGGWHHSSGGFGGNGHNQRWGGGSFTHQNRYGFHSHPYGF